MPRRVALLAAAALFASGCGEIGEPLPPLANIPARVTGLAAVERGSRIIVQFSLPTLTTESMVLKTPVKLDLRLGLAPDPFRAEAWAAQAKAIPEGPVQNGIARYEIPAAEWIGKDVTIAVRVFGSNGKEAGWSNFVTVHVVPPPEEPAGVRADPTADGVRLTWQAHGDEFRVLRRTDNEAFAVVATVQQPEWLDRGAEFGKSYDYLVQTVVKAGDDQRAESDLPPAISITPQDIFPPATPTGLRAASSPNSIELAWDRNAEPDLAGYRVYRSVDNGEPERIAEVIGVPSYSDHSVERGKIYHYSVSAFDRNSNESPRSEGIASALE